jgi:hypothetical protein
MPTWEEICKAVKQFWKEQPRRTLLKAPTPDRDLYGWMLWLAIDLWEHFPEADRFGLMARGLMAYLNSKTELNREKNFELHCEKRDPGDDIIDNLRQLTTDFWTFIGDNVEVIALQNDAELDDWLQQTPGQAFTRLCAVLLAYGCGWGREVEIGDANRWKDYWVAALGEMMGIGWPFVNKACQHWTNSTTQMRPVDPHGVLEYTQDCVMSFIHGARKSSSAGVKQAPILTAPAGGGLPRWAPSKTKRSLHAQMKQTLLGSTASDWCLANKFHDGVLFWALRDDGLVEYGPAAFFVCKTPGQENEVFAKLLNGTELRGLWG